MSGPLVPAGLRCAHKEAPLAVEAEHVRFSWYLLGEGAGRAQTAYQVQVSRAGGGSGGGAGWLWDSGRTEANQTTDVAYAGPRSSPLGPTTGRPGYGTRRAAWGHGARRRRSKRR